MRRWLFSTLCLWFITVQVSDPANAEDATGTTEGKKADALLLDLSVTESPAFVVLGITPDKVTHPASPREFATALQSGIDDSGNLQTGVAIDTVPYLLLFGDKLTLGKYRENTLSQFSWRRLLARTQFSLGTTKGTDQDDKSVRLALGFRATPWDEGDTRLDRKLTACIERFQSLALADMGRITINDENRIAKELHIANPEDIFQEIDKRLKDDRAGLEKDLGPEDFRKVTGDADRKLIAEKLGVKEEDVTQAVLERSKADLEKVLGPELYRKVWSLQSQQAWEGGVEGCFTQAKKDNWNASAWDLGVAPSWLSTDGSYNQIASNGGTLWTSLGLRLPEMDSTAPEAGSLGYLRQYSQLVLHTRYSWDTMINQVDTNSFLVEDDFLVGGRLRLGLEKLTISAEGAYIQQKPKGQPTTEGQRYALSVDIRLTQGVWLHITGGTNDGVNGGSQGFAFGALRYGLIQDSPAEAWSNL